MKAQVTVSVGDYDTTRLSRQFYELPDISGRTGSSTHSDASNKKENELLKLDHEVTEHSPSALSLHALCDDNEDKHCVRLVNIPITSTKPVEFFSSELVVSGFREKMYVPAPQSGLHRSYTSFCHFESAEPRCKQVVDLRPKITPVNFRDTIVLLRDCTRRRYRSGMDCWPRVRPIRYKETCYVTPKRLEATYVSYCDYGVNKSQARYQSAVQVIPRTVCNNFVRGFEFNSDDDDDDELYSETEASSIDEEVNDYAEFDNALNYNAAVRPLAVKTKKSELISETSLTANKWQGEMTEPVRLSAVITEGKEIVRKEPTVDDRVDGIMKRVSVETNNDGIIDRKLLSDGRNEIGARKSIQEFATFEDNNNKKVINATQTERVASENLLDFSNDDDDVFSLNGTSSANNQNAAFK